MAAIRNQEELKPAPGLELSLVIPVFNGAHSIAATVGSWRKATDGIRRELIVIDDGSSDETATILDRLTEVPGFFGILRVVHQRNSGHGPAIRRGYDLAQGDYVFQADSDDEIDPSYFTRLWERRFAGDLILSERQGRSVSLVRRLITGGEGILTWMLSGRRLTDPNVPFRLVRRMRLEEFCGQVRPDEFAPNLLMSLWALRRGWRVVVVKLPHNPRRNSFQSLDGKKLVKGCLRAFGGVVRLLR